MVVKGESSLAITFSAMVRTLSATDQVAIEEAVAVLKGGGIIVYPTDTVYGLGALAEDDEAVRRVFAVKGRAADKALPLLIGEASDAEKIAAQVPAAARKLMERFWPGGLTIVFSKSPSFKSLALGGSDTVALRLPDHPLLREIIRGAGGPITGTSANRSGLGAPLTCGEALEQVGHAVDLALDDGPCPGGIESTVVDITKDPPLLLRQGAISREQIESLLGTTMAVPAAPKV